jgi:hypothetical protein
MGVGLNNLLQKRLLYAFWQYNSSNNIIFCLGIGELESKQHGKDSIYILVPFFSKKLKVTLLNVRWKEPLAFKISY